MPYYLRMFLHRFYPFAKLQFITINYNIQNIKFHILFFSYTSARTLKTHKVNKAETQRLISAVSRPFCHFIFGYKTGKSL